MRFQVLFDLWIIIICTTIHKTLSGLFQQFCFCSSLLRIIHCKCADYQTKTQYAYRYDMFLHMSLTIKGCLSLTTRNYNTQLTQRATLYQKNPQTLPDAWYAMRLPVRMHVPFGRSALLKDVALRSGNRLASYFV